MPQIAIEGTTLNVAEYPRRCSRCHVAIDATYVVGNKTREGLFEVAFKCPNCLSLFIATWKALGRQPNGSFASQLLKLEPMYPESHAFPSLEAVSPMFSVIYNQAAAAEAASLGEIAGVGFRKALEFLIKDYCISTHPDNAEEIKRLQLGKVIDNYLEEGRVKQAAKRTAWLGNDETHYQRKWEGKDLQDLKNLLRLTITGVQEALEYESYVRDMPA